MGASCVETCAAHGDFDPRTTMVIGSPAQDPEAKLERVQITCGCTR